MWVAQSYLGSPDKDASVFVYYLYEDYSSQQKAFTSMVQDQLGELGALFKSDVTLLMPNPKFAASVQSEFVDKFRALWPSFRDRLPGLIITQAPMSDPKVLEGSSLYFPFDINNYKSIKSTVDNVKFILLDTLSFNAANSRPKRPETFFERLVRAVEVKPGAFGIRLDVKKIVAGFS